MRIGIFGTGGVGRTIAAKLTALGHEVMLGSRDVQATLDRPDGGPRGGMAFKDWYKDHRGVKLGTLAEAAIHGELLVNASSGHGSIEALTAAGAERMGSKVLLDISNPLDFSKGMPPTLFVCNDDSLGERIQRTFPLLRVVKTLNTLTAGLMLEPGQLPERTNIFMSGNDAAAKSEVGSLLQSAGWHAADIIDLGDITTARGSEQLLPIWVRMWAAMGTPMFNFRIVRG